MGNQCNAQKESREEIQAHGHVTEHLGGDAGAVKKLAVILKQANDDVFDTPPKHPFVVNFGLLLMQAKHDKRYTGPLLDGSKFQNTKVLSKAAECMKFAAAAYADTEADVDQESNLEILHLKKQDETCPGFFIAKSKANPNEVILSIRGKKTAEDAMMSCVSHAVEFKEGYVASELLNQAKRVAEESKAQLEKALGECSNPNLLVTGHCIGGGVATVLALMEFGEGSQVQQMMKKGQVQVYTFGAPPMFDNPEKVPKHVHECVFAFINNLDVIARMNLGPIGKLLLACKHLDEEYNMTTEDRLELMKQGGQHHQQFPDYGDIPDDLQNDFRSLHKIGTRIVLHKNKENQMVCEVVPQMLNDRILLNEHMFSDHLVENYEEAIRDTAVQQQASQGCCAATGK